MIDIFVIPNPEDRTVVSSEGVVPPTGAFVPFESDLNVNFVRSGDLILIPDPPTDDTPKVLSLGVVRADLVVHVDMGGWFGVETAYENGVFTDKYSTSTLNVVSGVLTLIRTPGYSSAAEATPSVTAGLSAFRCYSWEALQGTQPNMIHILTAQHIGFADPATVAAASQATDGPVWLSSIPPQDFCVHPDDSSLLPGYIPGWYNCFFTAAIAANKVPWTSWIAAYRAAGGREPEHVVIDMEQYVNDYALDLAPGAHDANLLSLQSNTPALAALMATKPDGALGVDHEIHFNDCCYQLQNAAMRETWVEPVLDAWPDASVSFYSQQHITKEESDSAIYLSGRSDYFTTLAGTHSAPEMYGWVSGAYLVWGQTAWEIFRWEVARFRACRRAYPSTLVRPWIAYPAYDPPDGATGTGTLYTREKIYHLALCGADGMFFFNDNLTTLDECTYFNTCVADLQARFGNFERTQQTLAVLTPSGRSVVSGMLANGVYHWRCTVDDTAVSVTADGVNVPILSGTRGVWVTRTTATPPVFVVT